MTLAAGNRGTGRVVFRQPGFDMGVIVDLLEDEDRAVQTVAGAALAAFSYNIASNQRLIARHAPKPLTFQHFADMLQHGDELQRSHAAFQVNPRLHAELGEGNCHFISLLKGTCLQLAPRCPPNEIAHLG